MSLPLVSCLCPTYGRPPERLWLLEEAVECFRRQTYPADRRELVILNDAGGWGQELACDVPGVRVINEAVRYSTLGDKFNALVRHARGELLCPWEDDDLSLPHRIRQAVDMLGSAAYWKPPQVWFSSVEGLLWKHAVGVRHHASIFSRSAWDAVGGYPSGCDQDSAFDAKLLARSRCAAEGPLPPSQYAYLYRWGVSDHHVSAHYPRQNEAWQEYGRRLLTPGRFLVKPRWRQDYAALCAAALPPEPSVR